MGLDQGGVVAAYMLGNRLSGMHPLLLGRGACPSPRLSRWVWQREQRGGQVRETQARALLHTLGRPAWLWVVPRDAGWCQRVCEGASKQTNKKYFFFFPSPKVWHTSLHWSGCPGFQQQPLVIGTAVFRCRAGSQARRLPAPAIVCHLRISGAQPGRKAGVM